MKIHGLTPRQYQVAELLADGMSDREIAEELEITAYTVDFHVRRIIIAWHIKGGNVRVLIANRVHRLRAA